ncbi:hypothetical protein WN55_01684 [Dufourea novaeangliae]|uniref:Uncharacterized protein n=1 Tax=Dufourea novaeangliae TaxID=178035 RepID=A0A154PHL5_DUFNO|nr:hypothetical protein WN55_01684 [Dufourea novaeangliae]
MTRVLYTRIKSSLKDSFNNRSLYVSLCLVQKRPLAVLTNTRYASPSEDKIYNSFLSCELPLILAVNYCQNSFDLYTYDYCPKSELSEGTGQSR